jgi:putative hydrolase of the HAD superfamily
MVAAIVLDAVGTLIFPNPSAAEVYAGVGRRFGSRLSLPEIGARFREAFAREEALDFATGLRTSEARELERWQRIVAAVLDDVRDPPACFRALHDHFGRPEAWRCAADAECVLKTLRERGLRLGLASNYDHRLHAVADGLSELEPVRNHLAISSEIGWRKPAGAFFAAVTQMLACPPEQILFIGDDRRNDLDGARAAGFQARLFDPQGRESLAPVECVRRLSDLLD